MTSAILIPRARTDWDAAGRYATRTPVAVNAEGKQQIEAWAQVVEPHHPVVIYAFEKGPSDETARGMAKIIATKAKKSQNLEEVSMGLWEGLTPEQLKKRFAKAYRQWKEDPASVRPPEGENLFNAGERLVKQIKKLAKKHHEECFGVVLGPLAFAAVRCVLDEKSYAELWDVCLDRPVKYFINLEADKATLTSS